MPQEMYDYYKSKSKSPVNKLLYNKINKELNESVIDYLVEGNGNNFYFNARLGFLAVLKFKRKLGFDTLGRLKAPVDWGKTKKLKAEGKLDKSKVVYITDPFYIGFKWIKRHATTKGRSGYKFVSSRTNGIECNSGANNKLRAKLKNDPLYHFRFPEKISLPL